MFEIFLKARSLPQNCKVKSWIHGLQLRFMMMMMNYAMNRSCTSAFTLCFHSSSLIVVSLLRNLKSATRFMKYFIVCFWICEPRNRLSPCCWQFLLPPLPFAHGLGAVDKVCVTLRSNPSTTMLHKPCQPHENRE